MNMDDAQESAKRTRTKKKEKNAEETSREPEKALLKLSSKSPFELSSQSPLESTLESTVRNTSRKTFFGFPIHQLSDFYQGRLKRIETGGEGSIFKAQLKNDGEQLRNGGETVIVKEYHGALDDTLATLNNEGKEHGGAYNGEMQRFQREIHALQILGEKNVAPKIYRAYFQHSETKGEFTPTIEMELVKGPTLGELKRTGYGFTEERVLALLMGVGQQLREVHKEGLLHRDLSLENIKVLSEEITPERENYCLLDFALSVTGTHRTVAGGQTVARGTPLFVDPRQWEGEEPTATSDLYSLGKIAQYLLGKQKISEQSKQLLEKMTAETPEERYWSVDEMIAMLELLQRGSTEKIASEPAEKLDQPQKNPDITIVDLVNPLIKLAFGKGWKGNYQSSFYSNFYDENGISTNMDLILELRNFLKDLGKERSILKNITLGRLSSDGSIILLEDTQKWQKQTQEYARLYEALTGKSVNIQASRTTGEKILSTSELLQSIQQQQQIYGSLEQQLQQRAQQKIDTFPSPGLYSNYMTINLNSIGYEHHEALFVKYAGKKRYTDYFARPTAGGKATQVLVPLALELGKKATAEEIESGWTYFITKRNPEKVIKECLNNSYQSSAVKIGRILGDASGSLIYGTVLSSVSTAIFFSMAIVTLSEIVYRISQNKEKILTEDNFSFGQDEQGNYKAITAAVKPIIDLNTVLEMSRKNK